MARYYLTLQDLHALHARQIELFGGASGVRDEGLLESALQRPQMGYYTDLVEEAAALWESIAMNHGYVDGNKRVAFAATDVFLGINGTRIAADEMDIADFVLEHLEAGTFHKETLEEWLHTHTEPR